MTDRRHFRRDVAEIFLSRLAKVHRLGDNRYIACCPAHDDRNPSMSISIEDDKLLTYCHAMQCSHEDILAAVGMKIGDFYDDAGKAAYRAACAAPFEPQKSTTQEAVDRAVICIARDKLKAGNLLSLEDHARYKVAVERLKSGH